MRFSLGITECVYCLTCQQPCIVLQHTFNCIELYLYKQIRGQIKISFEVCCADNIGDFFYTKKLFTTGNALISREKRYKLVTAAVVTSTGLAISW